ncbi:MAG: PAS domain S-box protein, partial [Coprothermobacterota bacterium]|nr:PAS domain S-box protein [Coprothermobacterota bacterium]
ARLMETTTSMENLQREVAERKQAEERLREALEELETTLHSIGDAVISTDLAGRVRQMNPVAEQLTGWTEVEAQDRPLEEVFHIVQEETQTPVENPVQRVLREGLIIGLANHTLLIDRNGVERSIADSGAPIRGEDKTTVGVVLVFRDQTRERAAEKELHGLMERQQAILAAVPDIIMEVDRDKIYTWANQAGQEFFGDNVIGHEAADYFEGEEDVYEVVQPLFNGSSPGVYVESWQRRKDGQIRLLAWWCRQLTDDRGNVIGALSSAQDITERKKVEESLRESEAQYRQLIEKMQDGVYRSSHEGKFLEVNPAMVKILGYNSEEELLAIDIKSQLYFAPEDRESAALVEKLEEMGVFRLRKKDGSEIWVEDHGRHVVDGEGTVLYHEGVLRDITERKRAEVELQESEERFRTLVENAPEPVLIQTEGRFAYLNRAALKEFGAESADRLIGTPILDRFHPDYHTIVLERIQQLNQGLEKAPLLEEVYLRMDGTPFAVEVSAVSFTYQGRPGTLVFLHSIEERKQLEKDTAKARTDFLYAVSHELKTPLFLMTATMEMMKSQADEERQRRFLAQEETWIRNLARLRLLINNRVDSQRTADLGTQLNRTPTDLAALVRQAAEDLDVFAVKQSITWQIDMDPLPEISLDSEAIERTMHNLLTNAIKFSPPGGTVQIRLRAQTDRAVLEVEDHGKGIPAAEMPHLFQPFARAGGTVKAVIPGTGLGLYVSKVLVEAHGGTISLQSTEGLGTTVTVTLPLRE